jgi:hypothetical protein
MYLENKNKKHMEKKSMDITKIVIKRG